MTDGSVHCVGHRVMATDETRGNNEQHGQGESIRQCTTALCRHKCAAWWPHSQQPTLSIASSTTALGHTVTQRHIYLLSRSTHEAAQYKIQDKTYTYKKSTRRPASADRTARRQFQATDQPVSRTQASDAITLRLPRYEAKCVQRRCFQCGSVALHSDIKGMELPPANIVIPLERQLIALQLCRWKFLYNETLQETFSPLLSKLSKRRQI